jgi:hypothetical protein
LDERLPPLKEKKRRTRATRLAHRHASMPHDAAARNAARFLDQRRRRRPRAIVMKRYLLVSIIR